MKPKLATLGYIMVMLTLSLASTLINQDEGVQSDISVNQQGPASPMLVGQSGCPLNCAVCPPPTFSQCQQCAVGFVLRTNNTCAACPLGCLTCFGEQICRTCLPGYTRIGEMNVARCLPCSSGCQKCLFLAVETGTAMEFTTCTSCFPGFYLSTAPNSTIQTCAPCLPGCFYCSTNSSCIECVAGFGYNSKTNQCYICEQKCVSCDPSIGCQMCQPEYYVATNAGQGNYTCQPCFFNCIQCFSPTSCSQCKIGFYPSTQSGQPQPQPQSQCLPCPNQCISCFNQHICEYCSSGYYLNIVQQIEYNSTTNESFPIIESASCQACPQSCRACTNGGVCQVCETGYFVGDGGECEICGVACHQCLGAGMCLRCLGSFYLSSGVCKPCTSPCSSCHLSQQTLLCTDCVSFFYTPINGQCQACSSLSTGCSTCTGPTSCLSCIDGYNLHEGQCLQKHKLGAVYIVMICIAGIIALVAIVFAVWACWRHRNGYRVAGEGEGNPGVRASYYQIP